MLYRTCLNVNAPTEADIDTPEMVETAAAVGRDERDVRMLERMAKLGMELLEAIAQSAKTCLGAATADGAAPAHDPTAPFNKMAQSVRRTLALKAKLGEEVKTTRTRLAAQRAERRSTLDQAHSLLMEEVIAETFSDALAQDFPDLEGKEAERLLCDMEELLGDGDEFKDFPDRPVGETVAKLCAIMGLDPALCIQDGDAWKVRRPPFHFEVARQAKAGPPVPPSPAASPDAAATGPPG